MTVARKPIGALGEWDGLSWTRCHGGCHGYNAHIGLQGHRAGQAVFFDFDESGTGYLAYDLSVFLWNCVLFGRKDHAFGMPSSEVIVRYANCPMRILKQRVFSFLSAICGFWGEYASRIPEWGGQAVPADWIAEQLDGMSAWRLPTATICLQGLAAFHGSPRGAISLTSSKVEPDLGCLLAPVIIAHSHLGVRRGRKDFVTEAASAKPVG
jgi:hypothetical protein